MSSTPDLVKSLHSKDSSIAMEALKECLTLGNPPLDVLVTVIPMCAHPNEELREHSFAVCESIEELPVDSAEALTKLLPSAKDDSAYWCATLLGRLGPDAAIAVKVLIDCLQHQSSIAARERAAWALGKIGSEAASAIDSLKKAATSSDQRLSRAAQEAIDLIS